MHNQPPDRKIPRPVIYVVGEVLGSFYYSHTKLNTLFGQLGAPGEPPPGNCVAKSQAWLFRVNDDPALDPLQFLEDLLAEFLAKDLRESPPWEEGLEKIKRSLAKFSLSIDAQGKIVRGTVAETPKSFDASVQIKPAEAAPPPAAEPGRIALKGNKRFAVALSFPGEYRSYVSQVAEKLAEPLGNLSVFYDKWFEHELARPNLDVYLQDIYAHKTKLIVVFLCAEYEAKDWCGLEWRAIRDLVKSKQYDEIMFVRMDNATVSGAFSIDGYIDAKEKQPDELAALIVKRLELNAAPP